MSDASRSAIARAIRNRALELGFQRVGFCEATRPPEARHFERWLDAGRHGTMAWLERGRGKRLDPRLVLDGARTIVVVALSYAVPGSVAPQAPADPELGGPRGAVSRYALGDDYHREMGDRLATLKQLIETSAPGHRAKAYVDTGPVLERMWAARAGIGWVGKNSLILNKEMGSFFFLGILMTTLDLPPDQPAVDQCGACTLCIEACPTGAFPEPRIVDSRRCISYQTIELRGALPIEQREAVGNRVFGCDDCQDACPWNCREGSFTPPSGTRDLPPRRGSIAPSLLAMLTMTQTEYLERFRGSAIKRATWQGLRRNAAVALGNVGEDHDAFASLERMAKDEDEDPIVREHAGWSASRVRSRLGRSPVGSDGTG